MDRLHSPIGEPDLMAAVGNVRPISMGVFQQMGKHVRLHFVIPVRETDPCAGGFLYTPQPCGGHAAVFLMDGSYPGIVRPIRIQYGFGIVGGAVVDHDDFQILIGLGQQAVQTSGKPGCVIVGRYDDGNRLLAHKLSSCFQLFLP